MLTIRIILAIVFWFGGFLFFNLYFAYSGYNMFLVSLTMAPGVLPFVPLVLAAPQYGYRWLYICVGIMIQFLFCSFDLLWGGVGLISLAVIGISLLYYALFVIKNKKILFLGVVVCLCSIALLMKQVYLYSKFFMNDICFNYEEYCGSSCYKDYNAVSCKTQEWKADVFHGSQGGKYWFDIIDNHVSVIFKDNNNEDVFFLENGQIEKR